MYRSAIESSALPIESPFEEMVRRERYILLRSEPSSERARCQKKWREVYFAAFHATTPGQEFEAGGHWFIREDPALVAHPVQEQMRRIA